MQESYRCGLDSDEGEEILLRLSLLDDLDCLLQLRVIRQQVRRRTVESPKAERAIAQLEIAGRRVTLRHPTACDRLSRRLLECD